ncbi:MAG: YCF48-related protein, partial [Candidatus Krumholzibacteria bacterium]|nr:YCF48-related protein [Candidatus Krumholzibacteria bacterium]
MKVKIAGCCIAMLLLLATSAFAQWQFAYHQEIPYDFEAIHFPTASVGYIVGGSGVIYKTDDGGTTWVKQTSPVTTALYDVFFTDATHGFAVGASGVIIYTTDGSTWAKHAQSGVLTTAGLYGICFIGSNGWMGGGADGAQCKIFSTSDGGTTWANSVVTN